ncbi:hypothetical protein F442_22336 [Phytophthora nicotianae P10297]|uniref:Uncharacterized protein n=1 Tax=Phytophthora nicotianae P10297 TaxID=1317064 RepID=W2XZT8_PHYNI|nr:hypothetical protein F442_22336 [Phytophthora nicotianae P10297]
MPKTALWKKTNFQQSQKQNATSQREGTMRKKENNILHPRTPATAPAPNRFTTLPKLRTKKMKRRRRRIGAAGV